MALTAADVLIPNSQKIALTVLGERIRELV